MPVDLDEDNLTPGASRSRDVQLPNLPEEEGWQSQLDNTQMALNGHYSPMDGPIMEQFAQNQKEMDESGVCSQNLNHNSILILLNNQATTAAGSLQARSENSHQNLRTVVPSFGQDPPISLEEALRLATCSPDTYSIRNLYILSNLISMVGAMVLLAAVFLFQEPKIQCFNEELQIYFRCSVKEACSLTNFQNFRIDPTFSSNNFVSQYQLLCDQHNMDQRYIFAIISSVMGFSFFFSGFLMDKFGRKKLIVLKITGALVLLTVLIVLGLIGAIVKSAVLAIYFLTLAFATFSLDIICLGFESLAKEYRENFVILYSGTRNLGIGVVCILFYYIQEWAYSIIVMAALLLILLPFFMKFVFESPHHVLASTGNIEQLRYVINSIAEINDEDTITENIAFNHTTQAIKKRRTCKFMLKNICDSRDKLMLLCILCTQWFSYVSVQMLHIVFLEQLHGNAYVNLALIMTTELLATLFSKAILRVFPRKTSLLVTNTFIALNFLFLLIFEENIQTHYVVTVLTRAALNILLNILQIATFEQFPTEVRGYGTNICMAFGMISGIGLPFVNELSTELILIILLLFCTSNLGVFFLRETKTDQTLRHLSSDIYSGSTSEQISKKDDQIRNDQARVAEDISNRSNVFDEILKELNEEKQLDGDAGVNQEKSSIKKSNEQLFESERKQSHYLLDVNDIQEGTDREEEEKEEELELQMYSSSSSSSELSLSDYEESVPGQEIIFEHKSNNHHEAVAVNQVCADEDIEVEDFDIEESEEGLHLQYDKIKNI